MNKVVVVGCGISGLSSAIVLARAGYSVTIVAKKFPPHTTSDKAAAFWSPYYAEGERVTRWARESYFQYEKLSLAAASGVSISKLHRYKKKDFLDAEDWESAVPEGRYRSIEKEKLPAGYEEAFEVDVPLIETQIFLPWLMNEFGNTGGKIVEREVKSLSEFLNNDTTVINCSGMGARTLANDAQVFPVKGQVMMMDVQLGIPILLDESEPTYIVQRKDGCIVGGTREENIFSETTDEETLSKILNRASKFYPELKSAKRISQWAGLRPFRKEVRVEREGHIIHNYGHGGSGFTLAWGCAQEVLKLADEK